MMLRTLLRRRFSTLLIVESKNGNLSGANLNTLNAATQLDQPIDILALGDSIEEDFAGYGAPGVQKVILGNNEAFKNPIADSYSEAVKNFLEANPGYTHVLTASSTWSKDYLPRLAAMFESQAVTDVIQIDSPDTFSRAVYAGNAISQIKSDFDAIKFLSISPTNFDAFEGSAGAPEIQELDVEPLVGQLERGARFVSEELKESDRPDLGEARIVVSGGRGLKNGENFQLLEDLADALGDCAIGASRAAVDAGYCSNDMQVGQTGKIVAPELYFAVGISGAIQHLAGMKDSKVSLVAFSISSLFIFCGLILIF